MALLEVLPPRNPLTDQHGMDDYVRDTTRHRKWHVSRIRGVTPTNGWNVKGLCFLFFFVASLAQLGVKPLDRFWQVIPQNACFRVSCIPRGIKIQKVSVFPHFCPKNRAWIGIFKLNPQNIKICILSKLLHRFKPNFIDISQYHIVILIALHHFNCRWLHFNLLSSTCRLR